jgi:hypothetical protein
MNTCLNFNPPELIITNMATSQRDFAYSLEEAFQILPNQLKSAMILVHLQTLTLVVAGIYSHKSTCSEL